MERRDLRLGGTELRGHLGGIASQGCDLLSQSRLLKEGRDPRDDRVVSRLLHSDGGGGAGDVENHVHVRRALGGVVGQDVLRLVRGDVNELNRLPVGGGHLVQPGGLGNRHALESDPVGLVLARGVELDTDDAANGGDEQHQGQDDGRLLQQVRPQLAAGDQGDLLTTSNRAGPVAHQCVSFVSLVSAVPSREVAVSTSRKISVSR